MLWKTATFRKGSELADGEELLQKADALMRRRTFVAGATEVIEEPPTQSPPQEDVPVLTEIVAPDITHALPTTQEPSAQAADLRRALAFELEAWLDEELPQHVMRVLDGLTDQLIIQLSLKARSELLPRLQTVLAAAEDRADPPPEGD